MTSKARKIQIGVFAVIVGALVATVIIVFGGIRLWAKEDRYRIVFEGTVMGLEKGAQVYVNGIKVGRVDSLAVAPEDLGKVAVFVVVERGTPIHTDTRAVLGLAGITGLKVIDLRDGSLATPLLPQGATIAQGLTTLDKLEKHATEIAARSQELMTRASKLVDNLASLTDPAKFAGIDEIVAQTKLIMQRLAGTSAALQSMVAENRTALKASLGAVQAVATRTSQLIDGQVTGLVGGASELLGKAFGDAGIHARSAVGVVALPLDAPVEVEIVVEVAD